MEHPPPCPLDPPGLIVLLSCARRLLTETSNAVLATEFNKKAFDVFLPRNECVTAASGPLRSPEHEIPIKRSDRYAASPLPPVLVGRGIGY